MEKKFRTVDKSELEDFDTACRTYGIDPDEFELTEHDYIETQASNPIFFPNAKLTITRNNISRIYSTGNATHWTADFEDDLRKGIFK
jgi:hypothetical protein